MAVLYGCDYIFACFLCSALVSCWCLRYLWRVRRASRQRLFWWQLLVLSTVGSFSGFHAVSYRVYWGIVGREVTHSLLHCRAMIPRIFCEQLSGFVEAHVALGFALACHGRPRAVRQLVYSLPLLVVAAGLWLHLALREVTPRDWGCDKQMDSFAIWGETILASCGLTLLCYLSCLCRSGQPAPRPVQRRVVLRVVSFLGTFLATMGGSAFGAVFASTATLAVGASAITEALLALNGAAIVGTYMFWLRRRDVLQEQLAQGDGLDTSIVEALIFDGHFDLAFEPDADVSEASRNVAAAVLVASQLRQSKEYCTEPQGSCLSSCLRSSGFSTTAGSVLPCFSRSQEAAAKSAEYFGSRRTLDSDPGA